jgi:hypothetical protein
VRVQHSLKPTTGGTSRAAALTRLRLLKPVFNELEHISVSLAGSPLPNQSQHIAFALDNNMKEKKKNTRKRDQHHPR